MDTDSKRRRNQGEEHSLTRLESLPSEIIIDILLRLPLSSVQFGYVCPSWRVLARSHLDVLHSSKTAANLGLILHCDHPIKNELYFVDYPSYHDGKKIAQKKINKPSCALMPEFEVVGSFDGLLCLADAVSNSAPYIYNPFTRDYIELPRTIQYPNQHKYVVFGFGYNPLTEVYKVVKITYYTNTTGFKDSRIHFWRSPQLSDVQIFSTWRPIWRSIGSASHYLDPSPAQTLVNGRLHWATWNPLRERYGGQLVSFDLHDEKFREVPSPTPNFGYKRCHQALVVSGCLAAVGLCRRSVGLRRNRQVDIYGLWRSMVPKNHGLRSGS